MSEYPLYINRSILKSDSRTLSLNASSSPGLFIRATREIKAAPGRWEHRGFRLSPVQAIGMAAAIQTGNKISWTVTASNGVWWCKVEVEYGKLLIYDCSSSKATAKLKTWDAFQYAWNNKQKRLLVGLLSLWGGSKLVGGKRVRETRTELNLMDEST